MTDTPYGDWVCDRLQESDVVAIWDQGHTTRCIAFHSPAGYYIAVVTERDGEVTDARLRPVGTRILREEIGDHCTDVVGRDSSTVPGPVRVVADADDPEAYLDVRTYC